MKKASHYRSLPRRFRRQTMLLVGCGDVAQGQMRGGQRYAKPVAVGSGSQEHHGRLPGAGEFGEELGLADERLAGLGDGMFVERGGDESVQGAVQAEAGAGSQPVEGGARGDRSLLHAGQLVASEGVDADADGQYDLGEPRNIALVASISAGDASIGNTVTVVDDSDEDLDCFTQRMVAPKSLSMVLTMPVLEFCVSHQYTAASPG